MNNSLGKWTKEELKPSRKEGDSLYGSRKVPLHESISTPTNTGTKTDKPRSTSGM